MNPSENKNNTATAGVAALRPANPVFLSPRIVDRSAFEEFAQQLQGLIDRAGSQGEVLRQALAESERLHRSIKENSAKHGTHLEAASKLASTLTERTAQVESVLARAADAEDLVRSFEGTVDALVTSRLTRVDERMAEIFASFYRKLDDAAADAEAKIASMVMRTTETIPALEARAAALAETLGKAALQARSAAESLKSEREAAERLLQGVPGGAAGILEVADRATSASQSIQHATDRLLEVKASAEERVGRLTDSLEGAVAFTDELIGLREQAEARLGEVVHLAKQAEREVEIHARNATKLAEPFLLAQTRAQEATARVERLLTAVDAAASGGRETVQELLDAMTRVDAALEALEPWRQVLLEDRTDGELPSAIARVVDQTRGELGRDLARMADAMSTIALRVSGPDPATDGTAFSRCPAA